MSFIKKLISRNILVKGKIKNDNNNNREDILA